MGERLRGKVAIVAGAGSIGPGWGNGKATATIFARQGAKVICADINRDAAEETAAIIQNEGGQAFAVEADVTKAEAVADLIGRALGRYGRIDILDNNVGIVEVGGVVDLPEEVWDRVFKVNLTGAFLAMKHVIPVMQRQFEETGEGGSIINISSIASIGHIGVPYASYSATKAALNQLTRATAVQYAPQNIRVNAILPGLMKTPMVEHSAGLTQAYGEGDVAAMWAMRDAQVPMGHMGEAWDVAYAALFLASDEARYVTGIELVVDGGVTLKYG
ncbi:SDR family NAD(P)-dependent oxidoreductase [Bosea caraganae]|uniref:SDR family NAD(P)-dependent oxidoreductase n=1 Tax=Bosea caraganae TaxID=2763117 RepID=A0A370L339_9HYPH|nr:glucose 1-dehydrogenase [Bosea caraganae]RDJ22836.1 SDR family NAD(P)-dependent oxidoreductase [Bosea caraganae]RDJ28615.1 SDR family NAD(P)-dependent oxidoreductase [Bosea caraganae]